KSTDAIIVADQDGKLLYVNPAVEIFFQKQASELLGAPLGIPIAIGAVLEIDITRANREQGTGEMLVVETTWLGKPARLVLIRDITTRKLAENALQESEIKFRKISSAALDAIIILDNNGNVSFWNEAAERLFGYSSREILGKNLHEVLAPPRFREAFTQGCRNFQTTGQGAVVGRINEFVALKKDGTEFPIELSVSAMKLKGEWNAIGIIRDITSRKQAEQRLQQLAHFDVLTNLPNRVMFGDRLSQALSQAKRYNHKLALLFLDLDNFKFINDTLGHAVGDLLLKEVAVRLNGCVRDSDTVARMGGDEFTVILSKITEQRDVALVAAKIFESITRPFLLAGRECLIGVSIGISIFPTDADNEEALITKADRAMYVVKSCKNQ
ncbi:MAG: diguanylate cyclase, partial [Desulfobulbaceae bacterium]|nr:diguanylate cyclase [Desulfobulbaceae bacterium]